MVILATLTSSWLLWAVWIALALVVEVLPTLGSALALLRCGMRRRRAKGLVRYPALYVIVPVYDPADTLEECIRSLYDSDYPMSRVRVFLVPDRDSGDSLEVYDGCRQEYPDLRMTWLSAGPEQFQALEVAMRGGKNGYVVYLDSRGALEPSALRRMAERFEAAPGIHCLTGAVWTRGEEIESRRGRLQRLQRLEYLECAQMLLTGRGRACAPGFSPFFALRRSALLRSRMYSGQEGALSDFLMGYLHRGRIGVSEGSVFFVEPVGSVEQFYAQRQRRCGASRRRKAPWSVRIRALARDRSRSVPRLLLWLALPAPLYVGCPAGTAAWAAAGLVGCCVGCGYLYFFAMGRYLSGLPQMRWYYSRLWLLVPLLPGFNVVAALLRFARVLNGVRAHFNADAETMYRPRTLEQKARGSVGYYLWVGLGSVLAVTLMVVCVWGSRNYTAGMDAIVNTFLGPMDGMGTGILVDGLRSCLPPVALFVLAVAGAFWLDRRRTRRAMGEHDALRRDRQQRQVVALRRAASTATALLLAASVAVAQRCYGVVDYAITQLRPGGMDIYEEYYVKPDIDRITAQGKPRNLIYIYLESMETSYASTEYGGSHEVNYIPNLTRLARENVSFSHTDKLGGFYANFRSTWTMAALLTTTAGVPYDLTVTDAQLAGEERYGPGIVALGDVLQAKGYHNEFICGSDAEFGGRAPYLVSHGDYELLDLYAAQERGFLPEGYTDGWWGFEDYQLYRIARREATRLWKTGQPFNLTLLTVDTHTPNGHVCRLCGDEYDVTAANITLCADRQVAEFVEWCKKQPFFEDTLIVITGDHPTMGSDLVSGQDWNDRRVYNCFINPVWDGNAALQNRESMTFDIFPTVVSAMGFSIPGDRLGLGVNLFSGQRTLAERVGVENIQERLEGRSEYYDELFAHQSE